MPAAKPTVTDVLALTVAEAACADARRALERAEQRRTAVRAQLKRRFPAGEWVEIPQAGKRILRKEVAGGRTFSLTAYEKQHPVTPEMEGHIGRAKGYDSWTIEDL